jgi:hypothetical protein
MTDPIDRLLFEVRMSDDDELRQLLTEFREESTSVRPIPSAELAVLMGKARPRTAIRRHGGVVTALIVVGTLGVGATAAAASPEVRAAVQHAYQAVTHTLPPVMTAPNPHGSPRTPGFAPVPWRSNSATPHPDATDHPGLGDNPGDGSLHAATPTPSPESTNAADPARPAPEPTPGEPSEGHGP